jgi:hypothetical protein
MIDRICTRLDGDTDAARRAKAVREKIMGVMQRPAGADQSVSPQSGSSNEDGDGRHDH